MAELDDIPHDKLIVLYDGVCALCNRWVEFILARDGRDRFRFSALQDEPARTLVARHGHDPDVLDTVYLVLEPGTERERLLSRGRAGLTILRRVGGIYRLAIVFAILPTFVLDFFYNRVARSRYRRFGKYDACPVPPAEHRHKFV